MVTYEWDLETVDEHGDVLDHEFSATLSGLSERGNRELVLVCDDDGGRSWAYVGKDGKLPEYFTDAYDREVRRVPKKFHLELKKSNL